VATTTEVVEVAQFGQDDAGFRIWVEAWDDAMIALGCTQVFSGIDTATVTMPTTANTYAGGRVYTLNDALHATDPIFIKLRWGRAATSSYPTRAMNLEVTAGEEHDGSGNVIGNPLSAYVTTGVATDVGELIATRTDAGISVWENVPKSAQTSAGFSFERVCLSGVPTADGAALVWFGADVDGNSVETGDRRLSSANYVLGVNYGKSVGGFSVPICAGEATDPSFDNKAPLFTIATFGGYDPLTNIVGASKAYLAGQRFTGVVNGVSGRYRTFAGNGPNFLTNSLMAVKVE